MKTAGIICEYNPFHNGHQNQIRRIRETYVPDAVLCVMSGDFTQRGEPALTDKYTRAGYALRNGADLVLELPVSYVLSSAEGFAYGGVSILEATQVCDSLCFGARYPDPALYRRAADILNQESPAFQSDLNASLKEGNSYPHARAQALGNALQKESEDFPADFLQSSNDILGLEYRKALDCLHSSIRFCPIQREGADHLEQISKNGTASGTHIRELFHLLEKHVHPEGKQNALTTQDSDGKRNSEKIISELQSVLPAEIFSSLIQKSREHFLLFPDDLSELLNYTLLMHPNNPELLSEIPDLTPDFLHRLQKSRADYQTFNERLDRLKSRNITRTRISRILSRMILHLENLNTREASGKLRYPSPGYLRVLGFTETGRNLLREIRKKSDLPIIANPGSDQKRLNGASLTMLQQDIRASEVCRMLREEKSGVLLPHELTRRFCPIP